MPKETLQKEYNNTGSVGVNEENDVTDLSLWACYGYKQSLHSRKGNHLMTRPVESPYVS
jgi:hypothetical protein